MKGKKEERRGGRTKNVCHLGRLAKEWIMQREKERRKGKKETMIEKNEKEKEENQLERGKIDSHIHLDPQKRTPPPRE